MYRAKWDWMERNRKEKSLTKWHSCHLLIYGEHFPLDQIWFSFFSSPYLTVAMTVNSGEYEWIVLAWNHLTYMNQSFLNKWHTFHSQFSFLIWILHYNDHNEILVLFLSLLWTSCNCFHWTVYRRLSVVIKMGLDSNFHLFLEVKKLKSI